MSDLHSTPSWQTRFCSGCVILQAHRCVLAEEKSIIAALQGLLADFGIPLSDFQRASFRTLDLDLADLSSAKAKATNSFEQLTVQANQGAACSSALQFCCLLPLMEIHSK